MKLTVNGAGHETDARSIEALVEALGLPVKAVLVEHNGLALRRDEWPGRALAEGDTLEIIRIVAGG
jgi:sulfur carrier protein